MIQLAAEALRLPLRAPFAISRGTVSEVDVVRVTLRDGQFRGRSECRPYPRYRETPESVLAAIESMRARIESGIERDALRAAMPAGAARNALDCALLDLECKRSGRRAWDVLGIGEPAPSVTTATIGLDTPDAMGAAARRIAREAPAGSSLLIKIKLGGDGDVQRVAAIRASAHRAKLIVDANESWSERQVEPFLAAMVILEVALVEQPLPAGADSLLGRIRRSVPICADESAHVLEDLDALAGRYDAINVKLDKSGGITEGLTLAREAKRRGLKVMAGCMVGSSLAVAPATLLMPLADFVDLDGPLWLADDLEPALSFAGGCVAPPVASLWG